jgi:hypothetical protein
MPFHRGMSGESIPRGWDRIQSNVRHSMFVVFLRHIPSESVLRRLSENTPRATSDSLGPRKRRVQGFARNRDHFAPTSGGIAMKRAILALAAMIGIIPCFLGQAPTAHAKGGPNTPPGNPQANSLHSESITNSLPVANSLAVSVTNPSHGIPVVNVSPNTSTSPTASGFTYNNGAFAGSGEFALNFSEGNLLMGKSTTVTFNSNSPDDYFDSASFSANSAILPAPVLPIKVDARLDPARRLFAIISLENDADHPLPYSGLQLVEDADILYFTSLNYVDGMNKTGQIVQPFISPQGSLATGTTDIGELLIFNPNGGPGGIGTLGLNAYDGGSATIDGVFIADASSNLPLIPAAVPEPGSLIFCLIAVSALGLYRRCKLRHSASAISAPLCAMRR